MESSESEQNFRGSFPTLSPGEIRGLDERAIRSLRVPGLLLMERASLGLVELMLAWRRPARTWILVGRGNNGGDGLAMARHLAARGHGVEVLCVFPPPDPGGSGDAVVNLALCKALGLPLRHLASAGEAADLLQRLPPLEPDQVWVDALLGTGFQGPLRSDWRALVERLNRRQEPVFAVDCPSGLDGQTGSPGPVAVKASLTGTLGAHKPGLGTPGARAFTGPVQALDIGWPAEIQDELRLRASEDRPS